MSRKRIPHEVDTAAIEENAQSPEMAIFAKTLNALLVEKNVHQDDMARALGISTGSISSWRNGKKEPRLSMIIKIADYLGVDCHYLMTGVQAENYVCSNDLGLSAGVINWLKSITGDPVRLEMLNAILGNKTFQAILPSVYELKKVQIAAEFDRFSCDFTPSREIGCGQYVVGGDEYLSVLEYRIAEWLKMVIDDVTRSALDELGG
ncbi:helix-turn-helix domain-containing protein [Flavonifractor sp. An4]|uniref:helix-turn-helix domain-containing protein n=1 Tax=Flavonifractor sp. An4 TaxID=1965634 RepID=UPI000B377DD8|nr:helix-turn-helix transcriptional regulator [Flavonifractor sp. An4]OUO13140.1 hypothetical protein B5F94_10745 [Flavonifractor sp. An4]